MTNRAAQFIKGITSWCLDDKTRLASLLALLTNPLASGKVRKIRTTADSTSFFRSLGLTEVGSESLIDIEILNWPVDDLCALKEVLPQPPVVGEPKITNPHLLRILEVSIQMCRDANVSALRTSQLFQGAVQVSPLAKQLTNSLPEIRSFGKPPNGSAPNDSLVVTPGVWTILSRVEAQLHSEDSIDRASCLVLKAITEAKSGEARLSLRLDGVDRTQFAQSVSQGV